MIRHLKIELANDSFGAGIRIDRHLLRCQVEQAILLKSVNYTSDRHMFKDSNHKKGACSLTASRGAKSSVQAPVIIALA